MKNTFKFDLANIAEHQPKKFGIKFDGSLIFSTDKILKQETVDIKFDDIPGEHEIEIFLLSAPNQISSIAMGNFKINHHDGVDTKIYNLFEGPIGTHGVITGMVKLSLKISTPIIYWQQKHRIY